MIDHAGRDSKSYIYKHCVETCHRSPDINDFKIIGSNFCKNEFKGKIAEALVIKQLKATVNNQEMSIELKLLIVNRREMSIHLTPCICRLL